MVFICLQYKPFENTVGKGEIARNEQFLLFPQCFLPAWCFLPSIFIKFEIVVCKTLWVWKSQKYVVWERVNKILSRQILCIPQKTTANYWHLHEVLLFHLCFNHYQACALLWKLSLGDLSQNLFAEFWFIKIIPVVMILGVVTDFEMTFKGDWPFQNCLTKWWFCLQRFNWLWSSQKFRWAIFVQVIPMVNFHFEFLYSPWIPNYVSYQLETPHTDKKCYGEMQCTRTITL